jgi:hypothetical protein
MLYIALSIHAKMAVSLILKQILKRADARGHFLVQLVW